MPWILPQIKARGKTPAQAMMPIMQLILCLTGSIKTGMKNNEITICAKASQSVPYNIISGED